MRSFVHGPDGRRVIVQLPEAPKRRFWELVLPKNVKELRFANLERECQG